LISIQILEDREDISQKQDSLDILDSETAAMWWAGKRLMPEDKLMKSVGKNEKTKIIVKLQKGESGPPVREPPIDEETQKMMLSYYYKKQEEEKVCLPSI
jgi:cilia- and flagella-associated protein 298